MAKKTRPTKKAKVDLSRPKSSPANRTTAPDVTPVPVVAVEDLTPKRLWQDYASQRKPVLIQGHLQQKEWKATDRWTNEHLLKTAVSAILCSSLVHHAAELHACACVLHGQTSHSR